MRHPSELLLGKNLLQNALQSPLYVVWVIVFVSVLTVVIIRKLMKL